MYTYYMYFMSRLVAWKLLKIHAHIFRWIFGIFFIFLFFFGKSCNLWRRPEGPICYGIPTKLGQRIRSPFFFLFLETPRQSYWIWIPCKYWAVSLGFRPLANKREKISPYPNRLKRESKSNNWNTFDIYTPNCVINTPSKI